MNVGPSGGSIPGLIPRGGGHSQQIKVSGGRVINITGGSSPVVTLGPAQPRRVTTGTKLMRLRCRFRPLHDQYIKNGRIVEEDTDVIFLCGDGHQLKAHKVIMASSSKFFAEIFQDQKGMIAVVSVPDIKVDTMKLILQLTYCDRVYLTMSQIKEVGDFITLFGMAWTQFGYEEHEGDQPMSATPLPPVPMKPVELPKKVIYASQQIQQRKVVSSPSGRSPVQHNLMNGREDEVIAAGQQSQAQNDRRKSRLTPRPGTEGEEIVEQDVEEDPENRIKDWMSKLGKRVGTLQNEANVSKKPRSESQNDPPLVCSVCNTRFVTQIAWKWHEERHVGLNMFKCKFCDELSRSPKACYIHEKEVHGYSGLQQNVSTPNHPTPTPPQQPPQLQQQQQQQQQQEAAGTSKAGVVSTTTVANKPGTLVYRSNKTGKFVSVGHHNFKRIKMQTYKKLQAKKKPINTISGRNTQIGIGVSQGSELIDANKIKQLHWLYVCQRCDNCADSAQKAVNHYIRCYPNKEKDFEDTVMKYRQGFYGKNKCPLCPRRYPQNTGFMIHCGHQHQEYRRLFTHTGAGDDMIKCVNCKEAFNDPMSFHQHMESTADGAMYCPEEPKEESAIENVAPSKPTSSSTRSSDGPVTTKSGRTVRPRRVESPIEHKAQYKVQFHTPPKSARLANRIKAEAEAQQNAQQKQEAAAASSSSSSSSTAEISPPPSKKAKPEPADINFPPVDCPVCGEGELPNLSSHLQLKHKDLNVNVTRISSELLRCKGCTITFDICDLLDHKNCVTANTNEAPPEDTETESEKTSPRRASTSSAKVAAITTVDVDSLPPGVGRSPIENIEIEDLHSIDAIRTALKCGVCGKEALKLGAIADCLRSHGVHRCALCFNSYCNKADYAAHLRKCHGASSNKLKCPLCPKVFANAGQTSGHMYSTHWLTILKENEVAVKKKDPNSNSPPKFKDSVEEFLTPLDQEPMKGEIKASQDDRDESEKMEEDDEDESNALVIDENTGEEQDGNKKNDSKEEEDVDIE